MKSWRVKKWSQKFDWRRCYLSIAIFWESYFANLFWLILAKSGPIGPIFMFLVPNMTFLGMPCWFRHFSSTSDAWRLQIGLRSTEPPNLPVYFYILLILHSKTDILNFGLFWLVRDLKRPTHFALKTHLYKHSHISAMTQLFHFNPLENS